MEMYAANGEIIAPYIAPKRVSVSEHAWKTILQIVEKIYPLEACGALFGSIRGEIARISDVEELANILASPSAFWFDIKDWMNAIIKHKNAGREYLGLFHSHGRERPLLSLSDRQGMLECPGEI